MRGLTDEEAKDWCRKVGLTFTEKQDLLYPGPEVFRFYVATPEEFLRIAGLTRVMLTFRGESLFSGGLVWLRQWNVGNTQSRSMGWRIIEGLRHVHGELRPLAEAPAILFGEDELNEMNAALAQIAGFGWVADMVPSDGEFFVHFSYRHLSFVCNSADTLEFVRRRFYYWKPTEEEPTVESK